MSFQPVVPFGGFSGWQFLKRTMEDQRQVHDAAPRRQSDTEYFAERIGTVLTAEQLVSDRRLLRVALGAFGLDEDINNRAFIKQVLEQGTQERDALANKLTDRRYRQFSEAFGFGNGVLPETGRSGFADRITEQYLERQFEIGVGNADPDMRLALTLERELPELVARGLEDDTAWYAIMGNPPMRKAFEVALGLPKSFGALDLDRQLGDFRDRAKRILGVSSVQDFAAPEKREELTRMFLIRSQLSGATGPGVDSPALTLLSQSARGAGGLFSLL